MLEAMKKGKTALQTFFAAFLVGLHKLHAGLCGKEGCQVAVDTGSSLLMGPQNLIAAMTKKLDIDDKCEKACLDGSDILVHVTDHPLPPHRRNQSHPLSGVSL